MAASAPGPRGARAVPLLLALQRDPLRAFEDARDTWGPVVRVPLGDRTFWVVGDHAGARHVLVDNGKNYVKDTWTFGLLRSVLGDGLLTSEGETWRTHRRLVQPAFHKELLDGFAAIVREETDRAIDRWRGTIDLGEEMTRLTLAVVARGVLGVDPATCALGPHLSAVLAHLHDRTRRAVDLFPRARERRFQAHVDALDGIVDAIVREGRKRQGLVGMLLDAGLDARAVRDEVLTMLLAGHETTAVHLVWTLLLLSEHPDVVARLATAPELRTARAVVEESLRLFPPVWLLERRALADDVVSGVPLPAGATVAISTHAIQRDPSAYPHPDRFDPDREQRPLFAFGGGARTCIGEAFARTEATIALDRIVKGVRLARASAMPIRPVAMATLRPSSAVLMRVS